MSTPEQELKDHGDPYERVVAAAREARRINAARIFEDDDSVKVTTTAIRRVVEGEVKWEIVSDKEEALEAEKAKEKKTGEEDHSFDD